MIYDSIPALTKNEVLECVYSNHSSVDDKVFHLYSAAYCFEIPEAAELFLDVLKTSEIELKNKVTDVIEAFMQSRQTSYMAQEFIDIIISPRSEIANAQNAIDAIQEFMNMFPAN